jgi:aminoglycoside 6'-N-acetyltransferase
MAVSDLALVDGWLREPHVARWWTRDTTAEAELTKYRARIERPSRTTMVMAVSEDECIGWCQWYRWDDYPAEAEAMDAMPAEVGLDYAIGKASAVGQGLGTSLIAALVRDLRMHLGDVGLLVGPDARNAASRRILEKNAFRLVTVRTVVTEPSKDPIAIYRLPPESAASTQSGT